MFSTYSDLLRTTGSARLIIAGFFARMPIAMDSLAIIFLIIGNGYNYSLAGALTASAALVTVIASPMWSKLADHRGQIFVLKRAVPMRIISITALILLVTTKSSIWTWFIAVIVAESGSISIGSMTRRRWMHIIDEKNKQLLSTSYVVESFIDETVFILGPILASACATFISPSAGLLAGIVFLSIGVPMLLSHADSEPEIEHQDGDSKSTSVIRNRALQAIALPIALAGGSFAATNMGIVAFASERNVKSAAGLILGAWAIGGATSIFINGAIKWKLSHGIRYKSYFFLMALINFTLPFVDNPYLMGLVLFLSGLCLGPILPNGLPIVEAALPKAQITQAMSLITAGIPLTGAVASFICGRLIDGYGASTALWLPAIFLSASSLMILLYLREYKRA